MLFPEGHKYSIKNKEYRTNKVNSLFVLTDNFLKNYTFLKQKTHHLKSDESSLVPGVGIEPTHLSTRV